MNQDLIIKSLIRAIFHNGAIAHVAGIEFLGETLRDKAGLSKIVGGFNIKQLKELSECLQGTLVKVYTAPDISSTHSLLQALSQYDIDSDDSLVSVKKSVSSVIEISDMAEQKINDRLSQLKASLDSDADKLLESKLYNIIKIEKAKEKIMSFLRQSTESKPIRGFTLDNEAITPGTFDDSLIKLLENKPARIKDGNDLL